MPGSKRLFLFLIALSATSSLFAAEGFAKPREFAPGGLRSVHDLPQSRLKFAVERLPAHARENAVAWLRNFHFTEHDLQSLHVDASGAIYYADTFTLAPIPEMAAADAPQTSGAALPVSPFPTSLVFHSRPGSPNVLYLNFTGETVTGTAWNTSVGRSSIPAVGFSTDSDFSTFSDSEQTAIRRIWQRVAEDYAPFDINVTTERPATFNNRTAHALITRSTDANGNPNPSSGGGGVAYINVFNTSSYATYRPSWIYFDNVANNESYIAEAVSHEIGHNLGLSHDGRKDGSDYYSGHGSGDTSWGPLMGSAYGKNVTQWSKGDYYQANNTQDDLATIASKLSYLPDDHGDSFATATPLTIADGTIVATTPESDPDNTDPRNKGILHGVDSDVFSFAAGNGPLELTIRPWISPSGSARGGNLDLIAEIFDATGDLVVADDATSRTDARISTTLSEGIYYLVVRNTGTGDPYSYNASGYTAYGSMGQFFIEGSLVPSGMVIPPGAELSVNDITIPDAGDWQLTVTYTDADGVDASSIGTGDLVVTGPKGYLALANLVSLDVQTDGTPRVATYSFSPPADTWSVYDNGSYTVSIQADEVFNLQGVSVPARTLGTFHVAVPTLVYSASMDSDPGWDLQPLWAYGAPRYIGNGPTQGYTGNNILGYNLRGNYENRLSPVYATTPPIDCSGVTHLSLRFRRWLQLRNGDEARLQASSNGSTWTDLWSTSRSVSDDGWTEVHYPLPSSFDNASSLQVRWSISSGFSQNDIGWNLDDVELLGSREVPPGPGILAIAPTQGIQFHGHSGGPFQPSTQSYTVSNHGDSPFDWSVAASVDWVAFSSTGGTLHPGATANISITLTSAGATCPVGTNLFVITYSDLASGTTQESSSAIVVHPLPELHASIAPATGNLTLQFSGVPGWTYQIETSSDLAEWFALDSAIAGDNGLLQFTDPEGGTFPRRFYRAAPAPPQ